MKKRLIAMLLAGAMCASIAGCSTGTGSTGTESGDESAGSDGAQYHISVVLKTLAAEYWQFVEAGVNAYAEEHPDEVSVEVKGPPSETSFQEQLNMIQTDLALESYDGYLIAPLQSDAVATAIANTDKPVVAFDTDIDSDKCLSFVGTGNKEAAKQGAIAAVEAAQAAGWEEIQCIEIAGVQGDATNEARMEGFREGINEAGGEFLDNEIQYANAVADQAVTCMEAIMNKFPDGVAIICANNDDMAMAAARTAADNPAYANTIFLGFDGQQSACQAVLDGELTMTAAQNNFDIGYQAVETIVKILQGEDYDEVVDTGTEIITQDNAADRLARFDEWLA